jgi:DNA-binding XRE family transcriptional regulator
MKKQTARLAAVTVVEGKKLQVVYTDRRTIYLDMDDVIERYAAFSPLSDPVELATVAVADWGWSLEWQCGATLDADRVFELSLEQAGMMENVEFRRWQDKNQLSLSEAAEAIGLTRRTVSQYRTGARPVSRTVSLACKGWEVERRAA